MTIKWDDLKMKMFKWNGSKRLITVDLKLILKNYDKIELQNKNEAK